MSPLSNAAGVISPGCPIDLSIWCWRSNSFPYLFAADLEIVARHLRDAARVLQPGGAVAILNFSYRGDEEADRRDVGRLAGVNGFTIGRAGSRDFILWDGLTFVLTLPDHRE